MVVTIQPWGDGQVQVHVAAGAASVSLFASHVELVETMNSSLIPDDTIRVHATPNHLYIRTAGSATCVSYWSGDYELVDERVEVAS